MAKLSNIACCPAFTIPPPCQKWRIKRFSFYNVCYTCFKNCSYHQFSRQHEQEYLSGYNAGFFQIIISLCNYQKINLFLSNNHDAIMQALRFLISKEIMVPIRMKGIFTLFFASHRSSAVISVHLVQHFNNKSQALLKIWKIYWKALYLKLTPLI